MQLSSILATVGVLAMTGSAAVIQRQDPYVGDLRTFDGDDCFTGNQGVSTFLQSDTSTCKPYTTFKSITAHVTDGWTLYAYTDANCEGAGQEITPTPVGSDPVCGVAQGAPFVAYAVYPKTA
ncbi:hypothetical protein F4809DRAFT_604103 [Biscogniauxia mediterranea]|nr:hypothetical protein F4809DRAFT_604103 [Biscogniauxia mediterranea]